MSAPQTTLRVRGRLVPEPVPFESRRVIAPGTGVLLRTEEIYLVGGTRYQLVVPGFIPPLLAGDDEFRRVRLNEMDDRGAIGAGPMLSFYDRHQALRWLAADERPPCSR